MYPIPTYRRAALEVSCWLQERAGGNPPQSLARHPIGTASGCVTSKQKLAVQHVVVTPAEAPDLLTLMTNGLVPTLWLR